MAEISIIALCTLILASGFAWLRRRTLCRDNNDDRDLEPNEDATALRQRTLELENANQRLEQALHFKAEFVQTITHELCGPLTSIKGFAEILQQDLEQLDASSRQQFLKIINSETLRIHEMINKLSALHQLDSGKTLWQDSDQDLNVLLQEVINEISKSIEQKGLKLINELPSSHVPCPIVTDPEKMHQILKQILDNALNFTERGEIGVSLEPVHKRYTVPSYRIKIWDSGIGIPEAEQALIFKRFYKTNRHNANHHGAGLGLALCREYLARYGADIMISSHPGQGTLVMINVPVQQHPGEE